MRILLIEDHAQLVLTLTQSLGVLGIVVESCGDGVQAQTVATVSTRAARCDRSGRATQAI